MTITSIARKAVNTAAFRVGVEMYKSPYLKGLYNGAADMAGLAAGVISNDYRAGTTRERIAARMSNYNSAVGGLNFSPTESLLFGLPIAINTAAILYDTAPILQPLFMSAQILAYCFGKMLLKPTFNTAPRETLHELLGPKNLKCHWAKSVHIWEDRHRPGLAIYTLLAINHGITALGIDSNFMRAQSATSPLGDFGWGLFQGTICIIGVEMISFGGNCSFLNLITRDKEGEIHLRRLGMLHLGIASMFVGAAGMFF